MSKLKLALCQPKVPYDRTEAIEKAEKMVCTAASDGAEMVVLPEMFHCPYKASNFHRYAEEDGGEMVRIMSDWARENGIFLVGGSIPELENGKLFNTCYCFDPAGTKIAKHRKIHLFDVNIPGKIEFKESDSFGRGNTETLFSTPFGDVGVAICFDQRFPLLIRSMALKGAVLVVVPAQFNDVTGPLHWHTIIRSRALDNQIYYAACSCATDPDFSYHAYGHSCVADPDGAIIAELDENEGILYCTLDSETVSRTREEMPTFLSSLQ